MALIKCEECGQMVSDTETNCPQCGTPIVNDEQPMDPEHQEKVEEKEKTAGKSKKEKTWRDILLHFVSAVFVVISFFMIFIVPETFKDCSGSDSTTGYKSLKKRAKKGDKGAQYELGHLYFTSEPKRDYKKAVKWYKKAAEQDVTRAQFCLGWCYANGYGVNKSYVDALGWWEKAAEEGFAPAQYSLGECYANEYGVPYSEVEAVKWFTKAAEQGHEQAQCRLADYYLLGGLRDIGESIAYIENHNLSSDYVDSVKAVKAVELYEKVIKTRLVTGENTKAVYHAYRMLGICYYKGWGVAKSYKLAADCYRIAASEGDDIRSSFATQRGWIHENEEDEIKIRILIYNEDGPWNW